MTLDEIKQKIEFLSCNEHIRLSIIGAYNNLYKRGYTDTFIPEVADFFKECGCNVSRHEIGIGPRHTIKMK